MPLSQTQKLLLNSKNHQSSKAVLYTQDEIKSRINDIRMYKPFEITGDGKNNDSNQLFCTESDELNPRMGFIDNKMPHLFNCNQESIIINEEIIKKSESASNIRQVKHLNGHIEYWYPNGNVKKIYPDQNITKMIYYNGDVREINSKGCVKYFYATSKTWHITYSDGFEIIEFPDGQQERRTKDGIIEVSFPDGSIRLLNPDGSEKWALPDGTIAEIFKNGSKILSFPNGQREIHSSDHKRREYPDGTIKYVYSDGTQKTQYANGRLRIKDKDGNLIIDSHRS